MRRGRVYLVRHSSLRNSAPAGPCGATFSPWERAAPPSSDLAMAASASSDLAMAASAWLRGCYPTSRAGSRRLPCSCFVGAPLLTRRPSVRPSGGPIARGSRRGRPASERASERAGNAKAIHSFALPSRVVTSPPSLPRSSAPLVLLCPFFLSQSQHPSAAHPALTETEAC